MLFNYRIPVKFFIQKENNSISINIFYITICTLIMKSLLIQLQNWNYLLLNIHGTDIIRMKINLIAGKNFIKYKKIFEEISQNIIKMYYKLIRYFKKSSNMPKIWLRYELVFDVRKQHSRVNKYEVLIL
jgi:hypothetical protein